MIIEAAEKDPTDELDEVATYITEFMEDNNQQEDKPDLDAWICDLLHIYDNHQPASDAYIVNLPILDLTKAMHELNTYAAFAVYNHLLLDTGAPKTICCEDWLKQTGWTPISTIPLPNSIRPFRFAGQQVKPLYLACLVCLITDIKGKQHVFRQAAFVLPSTPIPFLVGLPTQRQLAFNINLREQNNSHLVITQWNATFPIIVNSHAWLNFEPLKKDPHPDTKWTPLINSALKTSQASTNFCFPVSIPPWEREGWKSNIHPDSIPKLHEMLKHPSPLTLIELFRRQSGERKLPTALKQRI